MAMKPRKRSSEGQLGDYVASGWHPIAAHQIDFVLKPGESKKLVFILGYVEVIRKRNSAPRLSSTKPRPKN
jgi:cellobiose phosphorylase